MNEYTYSASLHIAVRACKMCNFMFNFPDSGRYHEEAERAISEHVRKEHGFISVLQHESELAWAIKEATREGFANGEAKGRKEIRSEINSAITDSLYDLIAEIKERNAN